MNRDHSVVFEIASNYCISNSFVDHDGYSISSKGFLSTIVDIMVIWVKSPIPVHISSLIPKMLMLTLAISCLSTSNLPWFMDLTFLVPMKYCSLQHQTLPPSPVTSTTGWWFCFDSVFSFFPELYFHWSSVLDTYWLKEFIFQCPIVLCFHTVHGVLKARILKWFAIPFSSGPRFVRTLHHDLSIFGGPTWHSS